MDEFDPIAVELLKELNSRLSQPVGQLTASANWEHEELAKVRC